ncbi:hypothetical protein BDZ91DRAFT_724606 [Kalaharituber pfeilii]|nr:hypothetical protein BDZ91DRAFT_724606 [Kalaharituber pfeilii]
MQSSQMHAFTVEHFAVDSPAFRLLLLTGIECAALIALSTSARTGRSPPNRIRFLLPLPLLMVGD